MESRIEKFKGEAPPPDFTGAWVTKNSISFFKNGKLHAENGPAKLQNNSSGTIVSFYKDGKLSRTDGPALVSGYGNVYAIEDIVVDKDKIQNNDPKTYNVVFCSDNKSKMEIKKTSNILYVVDEKTGQFATINLDELEKKWNGFFKNNKKFEIIFSKDKTSLNCRNESGEYHSTTNPITIQIFSDGSVAEYSRDYFVNGRPVPRAGTETDSNGALHYPDFPLKLYGVEYYIHHGYICKDKAEWEKLVQKEKGTATTPKKEDSKSQHSDQKQSTLEEKGTNTMPPTQKSSIEEFKDMMIEDVQDGAIRAGVSELVETVRDSLAKALTKELGLGTSSMAQQMIAHFLKTQIGEATLGMVMAMSVPLLRYAIPKNYHNYLDVLSGELRKRSMERYIQPLIRMFKEPVIKYMKAQLGLEDMQQIRVVTQQSEENSSAGEALDQMFAAHKEKLEKAKG